MKIIVGTRGSKLAVSQTEWVIRELQKVAPKVMFEKKIITTKGDQIQHIALDKIGDKGLFVKEIEQQLLEGSIDLAIHSMKDMPSTVTEGLMFVDTPRREDPRDALILKAGYNSLEDLPKGAVIGTGSKRRAYQLKALREDITTVGIRGNIDTRIKKIKTENLDGIILAVAGLNRLGLSHLISAYFAVEEMIPAPAQGALAIQIRQEDRELLQLVKQLEDRESHLQITAERAFLQHVEGSCSIPVGAYCKLDKEIAIFTAILGEEVGERLVTYKTEASCTTLEEASLIGREAAEILVKELKR